MSDNLTIDKYKLVNCIASGQHSQIWEAIDGETTRRTAMKLLLPEFIRDSEQTSALKHEFKLGSSFQHPNIIKYHEMSVTRKQAYFTMELFSAPNLKSWVYNDLRGLHVRFKRVVELTGMALDQIHERGWIHRDIKPDNLLMNKSAEVRVIDFSLASRAATVISKMFARKQATVKGTRTYMAPEQIMGKALTVQTDIYNFGVTLFEMLTGQAPFAGSTPKDLLLRHMGDIPPNPSDINSNITPEMDRIILRMLSKKPEQRQKKITEFLAEFRNVTVFREPVTDEVVKSEQELAEEELKKVLGGALDSRADALRTKYGGPRPETKPEKPKPAASPKPAAAPKPTAPQPAPGMMPMQPMPMQPMMPYPMQPMPMQPMMPYPMQQPYPMPAAPAAGAPMPAGPSPWVSVPAAPVAGGIAAPWMGQPAAPAARPQIPMPVPAPAGPMPAAARPAPPPVAPAAVPQVASRPAAPAPVAPKPAPVQPAAKKPAPAAGKGEEAIQIGDLLGFDDLPPV